MELYGRGQPRQYVERFTALLSKGPVGSRRPGGCGWVGGGGWLMAHAPLGLWAEQAGDGERADRAEGRPSMEITSDQ